MQQTETSCPPENYEPKELWHQSPVKNPRDTAW
jgi:hypothetical protein